MRIAQVAPLWERVPPPAYGGIELVVGLLTDELVRRGHEVTLFASGDSISLAKLESVHPQALRLDSTVKATGRVIPSSFGRCPEVEWVASEVFGNTSKSQDVVVVTREPRRRC
ncbi:MAG TPA: hypothetical protein V6C90_27220 [Coleofasciculaceae cyanobacterium]|jgi:glycosyltransferase involved in cell wall biosynthesis